MIWKRIRRRTTHRGPRPPFTIRDERDYAAAVQRVENLTRVAMRHPNPLVREQAMFDECLESLALGDFLQARLDTIPRRHRDAVERALRDWRWHTTIELRDEKEALRAADTTLLHETYAEGTRLAHSTGTIWETMATDLPGTGGWRRYMAPLAGDYLIRCVWVPEGVLSKHGILRLGQELRVHRHYLHSPRWRKADHPAIAR